MTSSMHSSPTPAPAGRTRCEDLTHEMMFKETTTMPEQSKSGQLISFAEAIVGHLGAAYTQRASNDDALIAEHIEEAYERAVDLLLLLRMGKQK